MLINNRRHHFIVSIMVLMILINCTYNPSYAGLSDINPLEEIKNYIVYYNEVLTNDISNIARFDLAILEPSKTSKTLNTSIKNKNDTMLFGRIDATLIPMDCDIPEAYYLKEDQETIEVDGEYYVGDLSNKDYREMMLERIKTEIIDQGFDGVFIDSVDIIEQLNDNQDLFANQFDGYMALVKSINKYYSKLLIIQNKGFMTYQKGSAYIVDGLMYENFTYQKYIDNLFYTQLIDYMAYISNITNTVVLGISEIDSQQNRQFYSDLNWLYYESNDNFLSLKRTIYYKEILNKYNVDFTHSQDGYVSVLFNNDSTNKYKLVVSNKTINKRYVYNLYSGHKAINYPLQLGNGIYEVAIYENTTGTKYKSIYKEKSTVNITSQKGIYLNSIQEVNWEEEQITIDLANELISAERSRKSRDLTDMEKIELLYEYVIKNYSYDYNKIDSLYYNYLPFNNYFIYEQEGICYDYSVLLASMLRSQGIPTKLVKGYTTTTDVYHAWNEIYIKDKDLWIVVDTTYDAFRYKNNLDYSMEKNSQDYTKSKEF